MSVEDRVKKIVSDQLGKSVEEFKVIHPSLMILELIH